MQEYFPTSNQHHDHEAEEWMLICHHNATYQSTIDSDDSHVWSDASTA